MVTPAVVEYQLERFWDDQFKSLSYVQEPFNDPESVHQWLAQGYTNRFTGDLCDMRHRLPEWSSQITDIYLNRGWQDIGLAFYRMPTNTILPTHRDLYKRYIEVFDLQGQEHTIRRALILLEDWQSGHYLEVGNQAYTGWRAGMTVEWVYDTPHMAANIGPTDRYSLQVTGHR